MKISEYGYGEFQKQNIRKFNRATSPKISLKAKKFQETASNKNFTEITETPKSDIKLQKSRLAAQLNYLSQRQLHMRRCFEKGTQQLFGQLYQREAMNMMINREITQAMHEVQKIKRDHLLMQNYIKSEQKQKNRKETIIQGKQSEIFFKPFKMKKHRKMGSMDNLNTLQARKCPKRNKRSMPKLQRVKG